MKEAWNRKTFLLSVGKRRKEGREKEKEEESNSIDAMFDGRRMRVKPKDEDIREGRWTIWFMVIWKL